MIPEKNPLILAPGWAWARLEQIADIVGGVTKDAKRQHDPSFVEVPYLRVANVQRGFLDLRKVETIRVSAAKAAALRLRPGDVLFTEGGDRDKLGRGWVWEGQIEDCIHQNHVFRARLVAEELEPKFISWYANTFGRTWFETAGKQTTNLASISLTTLKSFPVPLPPVAEQQRIVAEVERQLSKVDAGTDAIRRAGLNLHRIWTIILNEAALGRLVRRDPTDKSVEIHTRQQDGRSRIDQLQLAWNDKAKIHGLPGLPPEWTWTTVGEVATVQGGIQKQPKRKPVRNAFPFLRVANVLRNRLALEDIHLIELFEGELDRYRLLPGDLLVVEGNGSLDELGRSALWNGAIDDCVHQNHLIRVRPSPFIDPAFFNLYWNSPVSAPRLRAVASSTSGLYTLSVSKIRALPVPIPPMLEQRRIVAEAERHLSLIEASEGETERGLERAVSLRRAILKAAFEGRLVPQNPADEPAAAMLDRIAAARTSQARERRYRTEQGTLL